MTLSDDKRKIASTFDMVAAGYDCAALRLFPFCADRLVSYLKPAPGDKVLDVATGTGTLATALARAVTGRGRVTGIDISERMLEQADEKAAKLGLNNVDLHAMDADALEFREKYFNHVACSYGIFFLPDMVQGLKEWVRVLQPGGRVAFSCFGPGAFQPMVDRFMERIGCYGVEVPDPDRPSVAKRLQEPARCREILREAGLERVEVHTESTGYHLGSVAEWWDVVWNAGLRGLLNQLSPKDLSRFRTDHLAEVAGLVDDDGLWLDTETHFALGSKPPA